MANTKKGKPLLDGLDVPVTREDLDLDEFLEDIAGGTASIHILRMKPDGGRPQVGKCTMDDLREDPYEYIRVNYGPGKYLLMFRGSDRRIAATRQIEVEGGKVPIPPAGAVAPNAISSIFPADMPFQDKLLMMRFLIPEKPAVDFGAIMAGMGAMMTALRPVEGKPPADPMEMFRTAITIFQGMNKPEKSSIEQLREVAGVIKEFSADSKDGSGVDSPWGMVAEIGKGVVDKLAPALIGAGPGIPAPRSVQAIPAQPVPRPAPAALPVVAGQPTEAAAPAAQPSVEENIQRWLKAQIDFLKKKANLGQDPEFWAGYIIDNGEEPGCQALLYTMRRGATFENLLEFDPEIAQNPQLSMWFKEVFEGVKTELSQGNVDSGGEGRHAGNLAPNVQGSATGQSNGAGEITSAVVPVTN